jgi:hypothetical protein
MTIFFGAEALFNSRLPHPSLKAGVIEIQQLMDFSPKYMVFRSRFIIEIQNY